MMYNYRNHNYFFISAGFFLHNPNSKNLVSFVEFAPDTWSSHFVFIFDDDDEHSHHAFIRGQIDKLCDRQGKVNP